MFGLRLRLRAAGSATVDNECCTRGLQKLLDASTSLSRRQPQAQLTAPQHLSPVTKKVPDGNLDRWLAAHEERLVSQLNDNSDEATSAAAGTALAHRNAV